MSAKYMQHDVQAEVDGFDKLAIRKVGVRKIKMPISIKTKSGENFNTIAHISAYCNLSHDKKGINMSRNSRVLLNTLSNTHIELHNLSKITKELAKAHETDNIQLRLWFEYMYKDTNPSQQIESFEPCIVTAIADYEGGEINTFIRVITNEASCCPCSKNMSLLVNNIDDNDLEIINNIEDKKLRNKIKAAGFGAHNQRSEIDITVQLNKQQDELMWIEDIITIAKKASSSITHNILKREDEKIITELMYLGGYYNENGDFVINEEAGPKFVEDIARTAASLLNKELDKRILDYVVVVNNQESIHTTLLATAVIDAGRNMS